VILEALAHHLSLQAVTAVDRGLRHGVLVETSTLELDGVSGTPTLDFARVA
jgi:exopolyphosphatase/pppGpp-phosphohydrolase